MRNTFILLAVIFLLLSNLTQCAGNTHNNADRDNSDPLLTKSGINPKDFVAEVDGKPTALYILSNSKGMEACITNFGGRLVSLMVPDKNGEFRDVVLGHDSIADYVNIDGNFGAVIGRYGNRINQGRFILDNIEYQLPQNDFGHCLHGGPKGFHNSVWDARQVNDSTLKLFLSSPDGEAGFPGNVYVEVTYTLTPDNAIHIAYEASTDAPTILNLTNHSYFNLSANPSQTILNEELTLDATNFTPIDDTFMTTGEIINVEGTPFDFRKGRVIGDSINSGNRQILNGLGYDHNMVLDHPGELENVAAKLVDNSSGIVMEVFTDEPGIQFYVGNFLDGTVKGKKGIAYPQRSAVCLETQHFPDSPNKHEWPSVVVRPGEKYSSNCIYKFSTIK